jgi:hypothetical protein
VSAVAYRPVLSRYRVQCDDPEDWHFADKHHRDGVDSGGISVSDTDAYVSASNVDITGYVDTSVRVSHPLELAIRAPNGIWFFLVYDRDRALSSGSRPVMDKEAFDKVRGLVVPVAMATGSPWVVGRDKNEPIFSRGGEYEVVLTDALESDSGSPRYQCVGHYRR